MESGPSLQPKRREEGAAEAFGGTGDKSVPFLLGCSHYNNNCHILSGCCGKKYSCKECHNAEEDHRLVLSETEMVCNACRTVQRPARTCAHCRQEIGTYFCAACAIWSLGETEAFHCSDCKTCRKGSPSEYFHCRKCNACIEEKGRDTHVHIDNALGGNCPICAEHLFTSRSSVISLFCGHALHKDCFLYYLKTRNSCPVCFSISGDLSVFNEKVDLILQSCEDISQERCAESCSIFCHSCKETSKIRYTFMFHKCPSCKGYNTRTLRWDD